ncbi:hypothetical protein EG68_00361 [Paragonimus skrjabini miyazakii]|uniref:Uncharacterized protein n=1 Tax=Paragonimus skrjabini miyazakii TaxID=59628 RepID=A0A8S9ZCF3_9TREM|nr:hypothetical protein EG68_00361 [Paragonimus skrjabini miyazakii]
MADEDCVKKCLSDTENKQQYVTSAPRNPAIEIAAPSVEDVEPWDIRLSGDFRRRATKCNGLCTQTSKGFGFQISCAFL